MIILFRIIILVICFPLLIYGLVVICSSILSYFAIFYIILVYYYLRFRQLNIRFRLFNKLKITSPKIFIRMIDEHNLISTDIYKMNLFIRRSIAMLFLCSALIVDILIFLVFFIKSLFIQVLVSVWSLEALLIIIILNFLLISLSESAHLSYNKIYTILMRRNLSYRIKIKVLRLITIQIKFV